MPEDVIMERGWQMMNRKIKMSVSTMTRTKDKKAVYVLFEDGPKSAEFSLPEGELVGNRGFSDEEVAQLRDYIQDQRDEIYGIAKQIDPMKALLGY